MISGPFDTRQAAGTAHFRAIEGRDSRQHPHPRIRHPTPISKTSLLRFFRPLPASGVKGRVNERFSQLLVAEQPSSCILATRVWPRP